MKQYKAILFHPEGDFVTDFRDRQTIQDVWEEVEDMGSRWIFYPLVFVATEKTVVDTPQGLEFLKGKRIKTVKNYLSENWKVNKEAICEAINEGLPLSFVYEPEIFVIELSH